MGSNVTPSPDATNPRSIPIDYRLFRQSMGIAPYQYVIEQRVEWAKRLLRQPQLMAIADIALDCGFSNQSNLCKHFRKLTGMTPNAYRNSLA